MVSIWQVKYSVAHFSGFCGFFSLLYPKYGIDVQQKMQYFVFFLLGLAYGWSKNRRQHFPLNFDTNNMWTISSGLKKTKKYIRESWSALEWNRRFFSTFTLFLSVYFVSNFRAYTCTSNRIKKMLHHSCMGMCVFFFYRSYSIPFHNKTHYSTIFHGSSI